MAISYREIRTERQWRSSTGLTKDQFFKLVEQFRIEYEEVFDECLSEASNHRILKTYEDLLFFGLYSFKSGLTYDLLALSFGMSNSNIYENQSLVIRILENILSATGDLPLRAVESEEAFKSYLQQDSTLLIDVTEQKIQRSVNQDIQKEDYSGKKKYIPPNA